ncbi:alpha/beta fold hydrolase [Hoyosella altamirensis]|uniref:Pimeloyl-ACP methyl ester carboxylesterase n=1 Tax=Hoyosella altamirensis TaxID=616997 RepID=A0A839RQG0_9ACTN|nr:alpha/beta hydrolase [Hoyosella altamirensis]MBB3038458.1 pimeloyl-ACP methyl ester carboxylesterase [Hoyosella altamirensis]
MAALPFRALRPVPDAEPTVSYRVIHGYRRAYRIAGSGPAILLLHGIGDNSSTWTDIIPHLAKSFTVIAPDLLGHGLSDKPRADYSIAAYANGMRDLLSVLEIDRVTVIGHSLGGGVAMQFTYQYPQLVERLILVGAGGITRDVSPLLRLVSLPGAAKLIEIFRLPGIVYAVGALGKALKPMSPHFHDTPDLLRILSDLPDPVNRAAFLRTLRSVVDWRGQVVTGLDRCYLAEAMPVQIIWGEHDNVIPVAHAHLAHAAMPGSRLEIFKSSAHFPFHDDPMRFLSIVEEFIASTAPHTFDDVRWKRLLNRGISDSSIIGNSWTRSAVFHAMGSSERSAT